MALIFEVKVVPSAGRSAWALDKAGTLKGLLKSPAQKGKANKELIERIAAILKIPQHDVEILSGLSARKKRIKVETDKTYDQLLLLCNVKNGVQGALF